MSRRFLSLLVATLALALAASIAPSRPPVLAASPTPTPVMPMPAPPYTFSFNLWQATKAEKTTENVIISPLSVQLALGMLYNGASGETQTAMAQALAVTGVPVATVNQQAQTTLQRLNQQTEAGVQLTVANSLWLREGIPVQPDFVQTSQSFFRAEVQTLPFDNQALGAINGWANSQTQGKIPRILDEIDANGLAYLLNAVYFRGDWTRAFDAQLTQPQPFTVGNGQTIQHPLMEQSGEMAYLETEHFQAVQLPYGKSGSLKMTIMLPTQSLTALHEQVGAEAWAAWSTQFQSREGRLRLPRFQLETTLDLQPILARLGMGVAFTDLADFSALTPEPAVISQAIQKTFMDVNETGTEAAAVTAIGITRTSIRVPTDRFEMIVNRPFFLMITATDTDEILFMGDVLNPAG
ncbi:MAG: serpin family protein [Synechococcales cyanobacterium]